ncbi:uncharacterized protein LTR77_002069 [Saxophila tyrrhenica]|uniref:Uncharacterized protein n=1 Tax=Saxophila tyrrhenica TaxID=1690608 RepID=A0AAV9PID6_9PEZI|nr:hypothetical protein LTR77_002069 [Saxophila tyrrhenica]
MHVSLPVVRRLGLSMQVMPALAATVELKATANPANPEQDRCYAIVTDLNGCSGTSEPFCSNLLGLADGCGSCNGVKGKEICGSAAVEMNFDTGEFRFENGLPDGSASCNIDPFGGTCTI